MLGHLRFPRIGRFIRYIDIVTRKTLQAHHSNANFRMVGQNRCPTRFILELPMTQITPIFVGHPAFFQTPSVRRLVRPVCSLLAAIPSFRIIHDIFFVEQDETNRKLHSIHGLGTSYDGRGGGEGRTNESTSCNGH